jgi:anti-sigma B factor antagonist
MPDRESFQLSREDVTDRVSVIALCGDADRFAAQAVAQAIEQVRSEGREVVVDLAKTTYLDSTMLAALVVGSDQSRRRNAHLMVVCAEGALRRSLQLKGVSSVLTIAGTRDEALAALGQP